MPVYSRAIHIFLYCLFTSHHCYCLVLYTFTSCRVLQYLINTCKSCIADIFLCLGFLDAAFVQSTSLARYTAVFIQSRIFISARRVAKSLPSFWHLTLPNDVVSYTSYVTRISHPTRPFSHAFGLISYARGYLFSETVSSLGFYRDAYFVIITLRI